MSEVEVNAIVVSFPDGQSKQMTIEDARKLYEQLDALFGSREKETRIVIEREHWPRWWGTTQTFLHDDSSYKPMPIENPTVWCSTGQPCGDVTVSGPWSS